MQVKKNVEVFNQDVLQGQGYQYTSNARLSSLLANERITKGIEDASQWQGKKVLDLGCGDGTYTHGLLQMGAASVLGLDPAEAAIDIAREKFADTPNLAFVVGNIYALDELSEQFDIVVLRGVLHHLPNAAKAIEMAAKVAREIIILEPNGANPVLKVIEKVSPYHRQHEEQSFLPSTLTRWCNDVGATPDYEQFVNLVPMFCPPLLARLLKIVEPVIEQIPLLRTIACGQIVIRAVVSSN